VAAWQHRNIMPRRRKAVTRAARQPTPPARTPRPRARRAAVVTVSLALLAALTALLVWRSRTPSAPVPAPAGATNEPLPYDSVVALANRVKALDSEGRYLESLAGARALLRQHELHGHLVPDMLTDYARMLNNAAFEGDAHRPRSSYERVDLERQALEQCQRALELARTPRQRSEAMTLIALVHEAWGFPYDAFLTYRAALAADPTFDEARRHYENFMRRLGPHDTAARAR